MESEKKHFLVWTDTDKDKICILEHNAKSSAEKYCEDFKYNGIVYVSLRDNQSRIYSFVVSVKIITVYVVKEVSIMSEKTIEELKREGQVLFNMYVENLGYDKKSAFDLVSKLFVSVDLSFLLEDGQ